jgi:glycosyltransferase involved in cell wall biosynthesis
MATGRKAALLEIYDSHDVNLYSQLLFLKEGGYDVTLIASERLKKEVADYDTGQRNLFVNCTGKKGLALWKELWRIRKIILDEGFEVVIFNTAHSNPVRNFCLLPFPCRVKFYGTLHGVNKLGGSLTQKIISRRIQNYFVLSDYMMEKAMKVAHNGLRFSVYYPIFHPEFKRTELPKKPEGQVWVAIPGAVEYKRRDYLTLVEAFARLEVKPNVRFFLLGNGSHKYGCGEELRKLVAANGLEEYFVFFDGFVPNEVMHGYIKNSDALMPLIHPINTDMEKYLENQISGTFNLAFAYHKPLLIHDYYKRYNDFQDTGVFYGLERIADFLEALPKVVSAYSRDAYNNAKWTLQYQAARYLQLLQHD